MPEGTWVGDETRTIDFGEGLLWLVSQLTTLITGGLNLNLCNLEDEIPEELPAPTAPKNIVPQVSVACLPRIFIFLQKLNEETNKSFFCNPPPQVKHGCAYSGPLPAARGALPFGPYLLDFLHKFHQNGGACSGPPPSAEGGGALLFGPVLVAAPCFY